MNKKSFHGKAIYNPSGKAGEYSYWAANFYNGCSARCEYCYNRHGRSSKVVGCDTPTLKKSLINEDRAMEIFQTNVTVGGTQLVVRLAIVLCNFRSLVAGLECKDISVL